MDATRPLERLSWVAALLLAAQISALRPLHAAQTTAPPTVQSPLVELPDGPLWHQWVDLSVDALSLDEVIEKLRQDYELPLGTGAGLGPRDALPAMTLRLRHVPVEAALTAIAVAVGDGCRWRKRDDRLLLERAQPREAAAPVERGPRTASQPAAEAVFAAFLRAGLLSDSPVPGAFSAAMRRAAGLGVTGQTQDMAARLAAALPAGVLSQAAPGPGVPVGSIPPALRQELFAIAIRGGMGSALAGSSHMAALIASSPLLTGREPTTIRIRRQPDGSLTADYDTGAVSPELNGPPHAITGSVTLRPR